MSDETFTGTCSLCGQKFARAAMTRHLKTCGSSKSRARTGSDPAASNASFHLFVESRFNKFYWLHLAVPAAAPLSTLDAFLRRIWLECCGHLSAFTIDEERFASAPMRELQESGMRTMLARVVEPGTKFSYEYDYGSTTELKLKVVGLWTGGTKQRGVELLARNDARQFMCEQCGKEPAKQICTECVYRDRGWLCATCARDHECDDQMFLPVVNSPRVGVCAYGG